MDSVYSDEFVVFVRLDRAHPYPPEEVEQDIFHCSSYEEARRIRQQCHRADRECVIRYLGPAGGGD
ncbi:MAG TPA: hypothetical protein VNK04_25005 [Gemmataceae bacterium]|nr:hypothetical protein [Gemmataceae bacterium]